jgi:hypothetical protein
MSPKVNPGAAGEGLWGDDTTRAVVSRESQRAKGLETRWGRQSDSMSRMQKSVVVAMALIAAQGEGPMATFSRLTTRSPAMQRGRRKECSDFLSRGKELQRGMHDVRRAIPASWG